MGLLNGNSDHSKPCDKSQGVFAIKDHLALSALLVNPLSTQFRVQRLHLLGENELLYLFPEPVGIRFYQVEQLVPALVTQLCHATTQTYLPFRQSRCLRTLNQLHDDLFHLHSSAQRVCSEEYHTWRS